MPAGRRSAKHKRLPRAESPVRSIQCTRATPACPLPRCRVLFLIPGGSATQLQAMPAGGRTPPSPLAATVQVSLSGWGGGGLEAACPAVEKVLRFSFESGVSLAEWANLASVRCGSLTFHVRLYQSGLPDWPRPAALSLSTSPPDCPIWFSATSHSPRPHRLPPCGWPIKRWKPGSSRSRFPCQAERLPAALAESDLDAATAASRAWSAVAAGPHPTRATTVLTAAAPLAGLRRSNPLEIA